MFGSHTLQFINYFTYIYFKTPEHDLLKGLSTVQTIHIPIYIPIRQTENVPQTLSQLDPFVIPPKATRRCGKTNAHPVAPSSSSRRTMAYTTLTTSHSLVFRLLRYPSPILSSTPFSRSFITCSFPVCLSAGGTPSPSIARVPAVTSRSASSSSPSSSIVWSGMVWFEPEIRPPKNSLNRPDPVGR